MPADSAETARRDELQPPSVRVGVLVAIAAGALLFIGAAMFGLNLFYEGAVGARSPPSERPFPAPRLETSIDPRTVPASGPGPEQSAPPRPVRFDPPVLARAMQIVAARGSRAYDPPDPTR